VAFNQATLPNSAWLVLGTDTRVNLHENCKYNYTTHHRLA